MRIAVDAMGGDFAPAEIVAGCVQAAKIGYGVSQIILVGNEAAIQAELDKYPNSPDCLKIVHASEVVGMDESPAVAIRRKRDASISRAIDLVKNGEADAVFSAGNTGAAVVAATLKLRTLEGISRPAIAAIMPTMKNPCVLLDAGANIDCTPDMLCEFAAMGEVYAREILHIERPRVGLLSIGEEDAKGNDTTKEAFKILDRSPLNFVGNVESRDLFEGRVDVVSCDGFVGNVVLKTSESVAKAMGTWMKTSFTSKLNRKLGALLLQGAFKEIKEKSDPSNYGGAPLLGANGVVLIGHGSSTAEAVKNAIRVISAEIKHDINHHIVERISELGLPA
jgi:glycerol-3-phosphate acyltransferase PlsX